MGSLGELLGGCAKPIATTKSWERAPARLKRLAGCHPAAMRSAFVFVLCVATGASVVSVDTAVAVALARSGTEGQKERAARALWSLALDADNKRALAQAGGIAPLIALARSGTDGLRRNKRRARCGASLWMLTTRGRLNRRVAYHFTILTQHLPPPPSSLSAPRPAYEGAVEATSAPAHTPQSSRGEEYGLRPWFTQRIEHLRIERL